MIVLLLLTVLLAGAAVDVGFVDVGSFDAKTAKYQCHGVPHLISHTQSH